MNHSIQIRRIQDAADLRRCASLLVEAYNGEPWHDQWTPEKALEKLSCFHQSPKFYGWVAFEGELLVGGCVGNVEPYFTSDYFYLKEMFISPEAQRKGVGTALFEAVKQQMAVLEIEMMILFTSNEGFPFDFWKKSGFEEMQGMRMMSFG